MADPVVSGGYTVDDLDWLRNEIRVVAHLELDPWGSLIVSPATDEHELAQGTLTVQAARQLDPGAQLVLPNMPWTVPGGTGYVMVPDLTILAADWQRVDLPDAFELHDFSAGTVVTAASSIESGRFPPNW